MRRLGVSRPSTSCWPAHSINGFSSRSRRKYCANSLLVIVCSGIRREIVQPLKGRHVKVQVNALVSVCVSFEPCKGDTPCCSFISFICFALSGLDFLFTPNPGFTPGYHIAPRWGCGHPGPFHSRRSVASVPSSSETLTTKVMKRFARAAIPEKSGDLGCSIVAAPGRTHSVRIVSSLGGRNLVSRVSLPECVQRRGSANVNLVLREGWRGSDAFLEFRLVKNLWRVSTRGEDGHLAVE